MHERTGKGPADGVGHPFGRNGGGEGHGAACQGFAEANYIGGHGAKIGGKHLPCAPEACGDFVKDQQCAIVIAQLAGPVQILRVIEIHAARTLDHRFQNQRGDVGFVRRQQCAQGADAILGFIIRPCIAKAQGRAVGEMLHRHGTSKQVVHACVGVTHAHRFPGIAVIAGPNGGKLRAVRAGHGVLVLHGHFHRHFDGDRA